MRADPVTRLPGAMTLPKRALVLAAVTCSAAALAFVLPAVSILGAGGSTLVQAVRHLPASVAGELGVNEWR